jgi:hypothetical protein
MRCAAVVEKPIFVISWPYLSLFPQIRKALAGCRTVSADLLPTMPGVMAAGISPVTAE